MDIAYLDEKIKNTGLPVSYIDLQKNADSTKKKLENFAKNKYKNNYYKVIDAKESTGYTLLVLNDYFFTFTLSKT